MFILFLGGVTYNFAIWNYYSFLYNNMIIYEVG